jgi:hypothetical protein
MKNICNGIALFCTILIVCYLLGAIFNTNPHAPDCQHLIDGGLKGLQFGWVVALLFGLAIGFAQD